VDWGLNPQMLNKRFRQRYGLSRALFYSQHRSYARHTVS